MELSAYLPTVALQTQRLAILLLLPHPDRPLLVTCRLHILYLCRLFPLCMCSAVYPSHKHLHKNDIQWKCINIFMQTGRCNRNVFSPSAHCSRKSGENGHRLAPLSLINTALIIRKEQVPWGWEWVPTAFHAPGCQRPAPHLAAFHSQQLGDAKVRSSLSNRISDTYTTANRLGEATLVHVSGVSYIFILLFLYGQTKQN